MASVDSPLSSESEGDLFEVENILGKRSRNGKVEYLVRWKGFGQEEDSWEPVKNLRGCQSLIKNLVRQDLLLQEEKQEHQREQKQPNKYKRKKKLSLLMKSTQNCKNQKHQKLQTIKYFTGKKDHYHIKMKQKKKNKKLSSLPSVGDDKN
ncbi:hypothetical protein ACROYT_G011362 [Oculina patagonica]